MNEKEKLIPQRRFKEFKNTGTWEKRKLGEFADISTGKLDANAMVEDGEYDFYTSGMKKYRIDTPAFEGPAITIAGNGATVGYMHLADGEFNAYQRTYVLQSFQANRYFLYSEISKKLPRKIAQEARTGNIPYIVMDMLTELTISLPVLEEEQAKIGAFFKQLDNTIALHQRKLEKSKALKSAYLSEMFPVEGERKPKRRFAGFTDDWEQRKLGDMVEFFSGLTYSPDNVIKQPGTLVLRSSNVQNGEIVNADNVYVDNEVVNSDNVQVGDIAVVVRNGSRSLIGKHAAIKYPMKDTVIGAFMTGVRSDTPSFTNALLDTQQFETEIAKNLGATINQITTGNFKKMIFNFPEIDERVRIGDFFNQLDNTIALHQHKLEKLKNIKQAYLNEMFI